MSKMGINVTNSLFKFYRGKLNSSRMEIYYFATLLNLKK